MFRTNGNKLEGNTREIERKEVSLYARNEDKDRGNVYIYTVIFLNNNNVFSLVPIRFRSCSFPNLTWI